ncbi:MAG: hypothetical protein WC263_01210 [Candidatus Micrarchaeia archaeon]|jgi:hypothetical protein
MPVIAKPIHLAAEAKPARLSYLYLYRMYKFSRMKEKLDKLPGRISLAGTRRKESRISNGNGMHYETPITHYYEWKMRRLAARKAKLEKSMQALSAKLDRQEKLSAFVQKQAEARELGAWKWFLNDAKGIMANTGISMGAAIPLFFAMDTAAISLAPGLLQLGGVPYMAAELAVILLPAAVGAGLFSMALKAGEMLKLGREEAQKLVDKVQKRQGAPSRRKD